MTAKMTGKEAVALSGRSESWLRRHECVWCNQGLWNALLYGCGSIFGPKCDPKKKDFSPAARSRIRPPVGSPREGL
jgi:hypothetical protein